MKIEQYKKIANCNNEISTPPTTVLTIVAFVTFVLSTYAKFAGI